MSEVEADLTVRCWAGDFIEMREDRRDNSPVSPLTWADRSQQPSRTEESREGQHWQWWISTSSSSSSSSSSSTSSTSSTFDKSNISLIKFTDFKEYYLIIFKTYCVVWFNLKDQKTIIILIININPCQAVVWVTPISSGLWQEHEKQETVFVAITEDIIYSVRSLRDNWI